MIASSFENGLHDTEALIDRRGVDEFCKIEGATIVQPVACIGLDLSAAP